MSSIEVSGLLKYKDKSGNLYIMLPVTNADNVVGLDAVTDQMLTDANAYTDQKIASIPTPDVSGQIEEGQKLDTPVEATSSDGVAYVATVPGIDALTTGHSFIMVPNTISTSVSTTLNVNNLGAKALRVRVSGYSGTTSSPMTTNWLAPNKPVRVTYDGMWWVAEIVLPSAQQLYGDIQAEGVTYDNTSSGLSAAQVQAAIDELAVGALKTQVLTTAEYEAVTDKNEKTLYILSDDTSEEDVAAHIQNKSNPHEVTAKQIGAISDPGNGMTGQVLMKTDGGQEWADAPQTVTIPKTTSLLKGDGSGGVAAAGNSDYLAGAQTYTATLLSTGWATDGGYLKQTVTVTGLKESYPVAPVVDAQLSGTDADGDSAILTAFASVNIIQTAADQLIAYCIGNAPETNIPLIINTWG